MCLNGTAVFFNSNTSHQLFDRWQSSHTLAFVVAVLSMLGSVCIVVSFVTSKALRKAKSRQIVVYISVADFVACLSNAIGTLHFYSGDQSGCREQALFTTIGTLSFLTWTTCLAVYLYASVVLDKVLTAHKLMPVFHVLGWVLPLAVALAAYLLGALGNSLTLSTDGWCWVDVEPKYPEDWTCKNAVILWTFVTMKGWELLSYIIVPVLYIRVKYHIHRTLSSRSSTPLTQETRMALSSIDRKLMIVPVAYVFLRVWGTVRTFNFIFNRYGNGTEVPATTEGLGVLNYLQALGDNGQGLFNFVLFVLLTKNARTSAHSFLVRCCSCAARRNRHHVNSSCSKPGESGTPYRAYSSIGGDDEGGPASPSARLLEVTGQGKSGRFSPVDREILLDRSIQA